jgi:hypothetical protein
MSAQELRGLFAGLQAQIQGVDLALREGLTLILARFDANEQRFLAPLLARLDGQEAALVAAVLDALDGRAFPADELGQHLAMIQMALSQLLIRAEQTGDRQLAAGVQHAAAVAGAPNLDVKHKLKVTLPILPAFISYEGEIELSDGMTLRQVWEGLQTWATRRGPAAAGR